MTDDPLRRSLVSKERDQHADRIVVEARQVTSAGHAVSHGARVQTALERYQRRGQLTRRQADAGERLYRAWAVMEGARVEAPGCTGWGGPAGWTDAQVQASRAYHAARDAVGGRRWPLVFHVCVLDWTAARAANEILGGRDPAATLEVLRTALDDLADCFGVPG